MLFYRLLIFFQNHLFLKILPEIPSDCQKVRIQIRSDIVGPDLGPNCLQKLSIDDKRSVKKLSADDKRWVNWKTNTKMTVSCLVSDNMECLLTVDLYTPMVKHTISFLLLCVMMLILILHSTNFERQVFLL